MWSTRYRGSCWSFDQCGDLYQLPTQRLGTAFNELRDFFKFKIRFADPEWFGATAVSDFFGCQWRNELSISAISRVGCVSRANSVICGRSAELFSNFLENWKQPISFQQPHPTRKCAPTAQIGRRDGPICHSRDLVIDLISKLIFNF